MKKLALVLGGLAGMVGLVFAANRRGANPPQAMAAPIGPVGDVISVGGERIHLIDQGSGPVLILLHGFAANTFSWRKNIEELAQNYRVLALDFPGFGYSDRAATLDYSHNAHAARVVALMEQLGIERAFIAGHSMGGGIAQRIAVRYPERVAGLVLVASVDASSPFQRGRRGGRGLQTGMRLFQRNRQFMTWACRGGLRRCVRKPALVDSAMVAGYSEPLLLPGTVEALFSMAAATASEAPVSLGDISAPTLIIAGASDRIVPMATAEALHRGISGSQLVVLDAAGHLVPEEQPGEFARAVEDFLGANAVV